MYKEIKGNLISLALEGAFDVIAHGCNCFNLQRAGIAAQMSTVFFTHAFPLEESILKGSIDKLGRIDFQKRRVGNRQSSHRWNANMVYFNTDFWLPKDQTKSLTVVNAYTQYEPGPNLDIEALVLCMRKMNHIFKGKHIGLPQIGCGIAAGSWDVVKFIIQKELKDCDVTVVIYNGK